MRYANLHAHSDYSNTRLIDSIIKIPNLIDASHELGMGATALTDHEFLGGHLKALEYLKKRQDENPDDETWQNFKVILGNEIYLCRNGLNKDTVEKGERYPHFILLALDNEGHRQLRELSSRAWERSYMMFLKRVPTWYSDLEEIIMPNQGHIIANSACIGSQIGIWFLNGETDKVEEFLRWCLKVFGEGNFNLEMAPAAYEEQIAYNKFLVELHDKYKIPLVIATDAHYPRPEDYPIHEAFLKSKEEERETADFYKYTYLMSSDEIYELMSYLPRETITEALENTIQIANRVQEYNLYHGQVIPRLPDGRENSNFEYYLQTSHINPKYEYINKYVHSEYEDDRYGVFLVLDALKKRELSGERLERHLNQIELELEEMWVVSDKIKQRLMSYFLTIKVIVEKIWSEVGSITGAGRGSGPASVVCNLLGISDGDPLEQGFDLWFYRFIHRERAELADWDFDSEASRRDDITQMVYKMCKDIGGDSVSVCTFGTEGSRSAVLTACRGMGLSNDVGQYLSSLIGQNRGFSYSLEDTYYGNPDKDIPQSEDFKREIDKYPGLFKTACTISGLITRLGQHACISGGSQILTLDGYKNIEDVEVGDMVLTHKNRYRKVLNTQVNYIGPNEKLVEFSGKNIFKPIITTKNHPFYTRQNGETKWIEADKLNEDDEIYLVLEDKWFKIDCKRLVPSKTWVYNLEVDEDNSYTVSGIAVHNCGRLLYNGNVFDMNALATTPNGTRVSQFDLGDSEKMGSIKYDFLSTDALDKIHSCMNLLMKDGYIEWQGSLRETYNKYLHPDVLDRATPEMWDMLNKGKIISAFQMDSIVAKQTLASIHPSSLLELAATNSLMRLVPEKGHKSPAEEYVEYKKNPQKLKDEIYALNGTNKEKEILYNYLKKYNGVLESQENMMQITMIPEFTNFSFSDASRLRKIVAKKKLKEIDSFRQYFIETGLKNGCSEDILKYIWDVQIKRQLGYSFNLCHCTFYSLIGLQEMNLAYHYPSVYWATAVLTVEAGALDNEDDSTGTNYKKIAAAIGRIKAEGYKVELPDINKAGFAFTPNAKENTILYGLKGISEINDDFIRTIIVNRPYASVEDFVERVGPQKKQMINLIKGGCFDEFGDRIKIMKDYLYSICPPKAKITLQNMNTLIDYKLIPNDLISYIYLYNFNKYIRARDFILDERSMKFLLDHFPEIDISTGQLDEKLWKKTYEKEMVKFKEWLGEHNEELIGQVRERDVEAIWNQYCQGKQNTWEMEVLGFYYKHHELEGIVVEGLTRSKYLTEGSYRDLSLIAGTVLGKDAYKHTVTILTTDGVIDLKFQNEQFAKYNRTISEVRDGTKKVLERSWFIKGTLVLVKGFKSGETFRVKQIEKIIEIAPNGRVKSTKYRYGE